MKIDNSIKPGLKSVGGTAGKGNTNRGAKTADGASADSAAEVALSPLATRMQEITANLAATPVVDASRVAEIKQAISEGRFTVDAGKIADTMIEGVRQLLAEQR